MFSKQLNKKLDKYHLLNHPFYKSWNDGKLTREIIKDYAEQYYQHVKAFPRYISATHSICEDIEKRKFFWKIFKMRKIQMQIILNFGKILHLLWVLIKKNRESENGLVYKRYD